MLGLPEIEQSVLQLEFVGQLTLPPLGMSTWMALTDGVVCASRHQGAEATPGMCAGFVDINNVPGRMCQQVKLILKLSRPGYGGHVQWK